jgi:hypothetical protein
LKAALNTIGNKAGKSWTYVNWIPEMDGPVLLETSRNI